MMLLAQFVVYSVFAYLAIGFLFSIYFTFFAVQKFDNAAKGVGIGFRLINFFGVVAFWVMLAWRMLRGRKNPTEINAHRKVAG